MRENRTSGSEGGETGTTGLSYPYQGIQFFNRLLVWDVIENNLPTLGEQLESLLNE